MPTTLSSKYLEDSQGNKYAPVTTPNAVRWPNGDDLDDKLGDIPTYSAGTNININNGVISAKGLPVGAGTVTSLANLPVTNRLVVATVSANQASVSISNGISALTAGCELHVVVKATAAVTITLPTSSPYVNMNSDSSLSVEANGYAEINFISDGTNIYVRAIV